MFIEFDIESSWYQKAKQLREHILRRPLGLFLSGKDTLGEQHQWHFGWVKQETLVAVIIIKPLAKNTAKLRQMTVAKNVQNQGIGRQLITATETVAVARGIQCIELSARATALTFYQALGYQLVDNGYLEQGITHYRMTKLL